MQPPDQYIRIVGHRKNVRDFIVPDRYLFAPRKGKTPEQDLIAMREAGIQLAFQLLNCK